MSKETLGNTRSMAALDIWLGQYQEEVIEPSLPIIDAHHHMWDRPPESYQLPELMADIGSGHDIRATVFVQCNAMYRADGPEALRCVGETEYVNGIAAASASGTYGPQRLCAGIVGHADLRLGPDVRAVLEAHIGAGGGRFRGIRQQAQHDPVLGSMSRVPPPPGLLHDADFRRGFAELAPLDLSFDAWIYFTQLSDLADLTRAFPETSIILNHIGAPLGIGPYAGRRQEVFRQWSDGLKVLARHANVAVKLGGMGLQSYGFGFHERAVPASSVELAAAWRPYVEICIDLFGPDRCLFESNFPVDKQACAYRTLWNAFKRIAAGCTAAEKTALFAGNAARLYRLQNHLPPAR
ncbi:amidohydrolase family protein [Niveispirillum sp. KHB5.9]|uniref:amidohydrolase family protein n=1 Tax=Niveispirillum sp. KHB5.9 TaxID=3400269 RepID=UPI003A8A71C8